MAYNKKYYVENGKLDLWREIKRLGKLKYRANTGCYKYPRRVWTKEELDLVLHSDLTDRELSEKIERSVSAIQTTRWKLKRGLM